MASIWDLLALSLFTILILLALGGNVLVCVAVFWDRKLRRQPENLFLVSLAVSDLFVSLLVMVFAAANDLLGYWPFGSVYCQFWICFDITCCTASILNLCAVAFDRYLHISRPMTYARYISKRVISVAILLVWLLSSLIGSAQIIFGAASGADSRDGDDVLNHVSGTKYPVGAVFLVDWQLSFAPFSEICHLNLQPVYAIISSTLSFFLPATIMILLYTKLYLYARRHARSIRAQLKQATSLLIMQLASHTALHYGGERESCNGTGMRLLNGGDMSESTTTSARDCCTSLKTTITADAGDLNDSIIAATAPSSLTAKATIKASPDCTSCPEQTFNMEYTEVSKGQKRSLLNSPRSHNASTFSNPSRSMSDQKARFTLGIIMGTFLLSWLPFFICNVWRSLSPDFFSQLVFQIVTWLGYTNSMINPIIYGTFNRDFRRAFKSVMCRLFYCCDENSYKRGPPFLDDYNKS